MKRAALLAFSIATSVAASNARAHGDPPAPPALAPLPPLPLGPARSHDVQEEILLLQDRLLGRTAPPNPLHAGGASSETRADVISSEHMQLFEALQLRRSGMCATMLGDTLPVDTMGGMLTGPLLAWRVGAQFDRFGGYTVVGGGTYTLYRHTIVARDASPLLVDTAQSPFGFIGVGGDYRLRKGVLLAAEVSLGKLAFHAEGDQMVAPNPTDVVQSAVAALRFEY